MLIGNIEVFGVVYKIKNILNNKVYIGVTTQEGGFNSRYRYRGNGIERVLGDKQGRYDCYDRTVNTHLLNSIKKYGIESFDVTEVLDVAFSSKELNIKEKTWISIYDSFRNGYNHTIGGEGVLGRYGELNPMYGNGYKLKGEKNGMYGKKHSDETKEKIRKKALGRPSPNKGRKLRESTKQKLRECNLGKKHLEESKIKMSEKRKGAKNHNSKSVICLNTGEIFDYMGAACLKYNIKNAANISSCCRGKTKGTGIHPKTGEKLRWMYYDDFLKKEENNNI